MSRMIDIDYEPSQFISSCDEELFRIRGDIHTKQKQLAELDKVTGLNKLFHAGEIKRKRERLQAELSDFERREKIVTKEREYYARFGIKIPEGEAGAEMRKLFEARQEKLDILTMIDCGLM